MLNKGNIGLVAVVGIGAVIVLALIGFSLMQQKPAPTTEAPQINQPTATISRIRTKTTATEAIPTDWLAEKSGSLVISYPPEWVVLTNPIAGGTTNTLYPKNSTTTYPKVIIETVAADKLSTTERRKNLRGFGFTEEQTKFLQNTAWKLSGSFANILPPNRATVITIYYVFERQGKVYMAGYEYLITSPKEEIDTTKAIVDSLKFQ